MKMQEIEIIIIKFLQKEANIHDLNKLDAWLRNKNNVPIFDRFVRTEFLTTANMAEYDVDRAKEAIKDKVKRNQRKNRFVVYKKIAIAASIVLLLGTTLFKLYDIDQQTKDVIETIPASIEIGSNKAVLTLGNGNEVVLGEGNEYQTEKVKSNGERLVYSKDNESEEIVYNYLTIPRGGEFFVQLADGTKVWLNSESKLKYPVRFDKGKDRGVELIYGEAYFEVSPSTLHHGAAFDVITKSQLINVLGTSFNIKAYREEDEIATTLVEGSVKVGKGENMRTLKPNQQSLVTALTDKIHVVEVDVSHEISWIKGLFAFNEDSLDEMMIVLSRWYDAEVIFENAEHKNYVFTGILEKTEAVEDILKLIEATSEGQIKFEVNENLITIK